MTILIALATAILSLLVGFFAREVRDYLKRIETAVRLLYARQNEAEDRAKKMGMADPAEFNWDAMDDQEKINFLNS